MRLLIDVIENHRLFCLLACYCYRCLWWKRNWSWLKLFQKHLLIYIFIQTLDAVVHFFSSFAWLLPHQIRFHRSIKYSFDYTNNMHVYYWVRWERRDLSFFPIHLIARSYQMFVCVCSCLCLCALSSKSISHVHSTSFHYGWVRACVRMFILLANIKDY